MDEPSVQIAARVRELMAVRLLTGVEVAPQLGLNQRSFSRRFRGQTAFTVDELSRLAQVLDVPFAHLVAHSPGRS